MICAHDLCPIGQDYVAELQAEVLKRLVLKGRGQWPAKELNLIAHLESHRSAATGAVAAAATARPWPYAKQDNAEQEE